MTEEQKKKLEKAIETISDIAHDVCYESKFDDNLIVLYNIESGLEDIEFAIEHMEAE